MRFGGVSSSKVKNEFLLENQNYRIIYNKNKKITGDQFDPNTSIYFGKVINKKLHLIGDCVIKEVDNSDYNGTLQILNEKRFLMEHSSKFFPEIYFWKQNTNTGEHYILVTERFGMSLDSLLKKVKKLSYLNCLAVLYQGIQALQELHSMGYIHNDIKTGNMCIGYRDPQNIKIIDFGITWEYPKTMDDLAAAFPIMRTHGTPMYVTPDIFYLRGKAQLSRKHDLQSLLYVVLELANGTLKWKQDSKKVYKDFMLQRKHIADLKDTFVVHEIDQIMDKEFRNVLIYYYSYIWNLKVFQKPDYQRLLNKIKRVPGFTGKLA